MGTIPTQKGTLSKSLVVFVQGLLNWTHVPHNLNVKNITVPENKIYQFAISANTANSSSGLLWATCTVYHNKGKLIC